MSDRELTDSELHKVVDDTLQEIGWKQGQPKPVFDLATSVFDLSFPVPWPNANGSLNVIHTLNRPTSDQEADYRRKMLFVSRQSSKKTTDEGSQTGEAMNWLWDQVAQSVSGYPGMNGEVPVTPDITAKMRSTHKQTAINVLTACDAEILFDESEATFDGGEWVIRLRVGLSSKPFGVFKIRCREWTEKERVAYEKTSGTSSTEVQGKTQLKTSGMNPKAFTTLFDAVFLKAEGDVTANGKTFAEVGRDAFAAKFMGEWKIEVVFQLTQFWMKNLSD